MGSVEIRSWFKPSAIEIKYIGANIWINKVLGQIKTKDEAQALVDAEVIASQTAWDNDNVDGETTEEKNNRIGTRPTDITLEE